MTQLHGASTHGRLAANRPTLVAGRPDLLRAPWLVPVDVLRGNRPTAFTLVIAYLPPTTSWPVFDPERSNDQGQDRKL